jgi:hypothetical protein
MSTPTEDIVESILCGVIPGENQRAFGIQDLGLACAGMPALPWAALRLRYLDDKSAALVLYPALAGEALSSPHSAVRKRADLLTRLTLAEETNPPLVARLSVEVISEAFLLASRSVYYRRLREAHLSLRARIDSWAREGMGRIAVRIRG